MTIAEMRLVAKKQIENCIKDQTKQKNKKHLTEEYSKFIENITDDQLKAISDGYWREVEHSGHYDERIKELLNYMFEQEV